MVLNCNRIIEQTESTVTDTIKNHVDIVEKVYNGNAYRIEGTVPLSCNESMRLGLDDLLNLK